MKSKEHPTLSFKTLWGKNAEMFDLAYQKAAQINASGSQKTSDAKEMREWLKAAREHSVEMRQIVKTMVDVARQIGNDPRSKELFVNPETKPSLKIE